MRHGPRSSPTSRASEVRKFQRLETSMGALQASSELEQLRAAVVPALGSTARKQLHLIERKMHRSPPRRRSAPKLTVGQATLLGLQDRPSLAATRTTTPALACFVVQSTRIPGRNPHFVPKAPRLLIQTALEYYAPNFDETVSERPVFSAEGSRLWCDDVSVTSPTARRPTRTDSGLRPKRPPPMSPSSRPASCSLLQPRQSAAAQSALKPAALAPACSAAISFASRSAAPVEQQEATATAPTPSRPRPAPSLSRSKTMSLSAALLQQRPGRCAAAATEQAKDHNPRGDTQWYAEIIGKVQAAWGNSLFGDPQGDALKASATNSHAIFPSAPGTNAMPGEAGAIARRFGMAG